MSGELNVCRTAGTVTAVWCPFVRRMQLTFTTWVLGYCLETDYRLSERKPQPRSTPNSTVSDCSEWYQLRNMCIRRALCEATLSCWGLHFATDVARGRFHSSEEVEMSVREWLRMRESWFVGATTMGHTRHLFGSDVLKNYTTSVDLMSYM